MIFKKTNLLENFFSLGVLQGINMILPLITLPYIVRVIGVESFGLLNVVLSIVTLFNLFIEFGFSLSATRDISINRNDINKLSELFYSIFYTKLLLLLVSVISFFVLSLNVIFFSENLMLFYLTFSLVIGNLLFPTWFFQGIEKMKYITIITVITHVVAVISIFVFIKEKTDYLLLPLINSVAAIISGLLAIYFAIKKFRLIFHKPNFYQIKEQLKSSFHFFLSRVANQGSRHLVITLVGASFGAVNVGYYTIADKLYMAVISMGGVISQTIYPYMSKERNFTLFKNIFKIIMTITVLMLIPVLYFQEQILLFIFKLEHQMLSDIFAIFMLSVPFGIISQLIGYPLLAAFGFEKEANNSLIYASLIYIVIVFFSLLFFKNILLVACCSFVFRIILVLFRVWYLKQTRLLKLFK